MNDIFYSSKDEIRNRVFKNAADYWGLSSNADFDPMVKLMVEALSNELFNISNEVGNFGNRMFDKVSDILAADVLVSALPAHAVLHARAVELTDMLDEKSQFFYSKRLAGGGENSEDVMTDIFFSPLKQIRIFNAGVAYLATGNSLFNIDHQQNKSLLAQCTPGKSLQHNTVYIGVQAPAAFTSWHELSFYFNWHNFVVDKNIYDLLPLSKWFLNDREIKVSQHKFYQEPKDSPFPFDDHQVMSQITHDIHAYYAERFLTIDEAPPATPATELYPKEFETAFHQSSLGSFQKPMCWIKVVFPATINQTILNELSIAVNAFPVVNKKLHELKHQLKVMSDIIPLKLPDYHEFLNVHTLRDELGNHYAEIPRGYDQERNAGLFSVRYGGAERFDQRNAREILDYLFELLRDEKAAFSIYGADFLDHSLKELEQNISMIMQKTTRYLHRSKELLNYIVVKPKEKAEIMFAEFWTTQAEQGNKIRAGSRLQPFESAKVHPDSVYLLSHTLGGRSRLSMGDRTQAYKYGLTTGDRIVTHADIVNFCFFELGKKITAVNIAKGLIGSKDPKAGFIKTVEVLLSPSPDSQLSADEWKDILELTRSKLASRSTMNIYYRMQLA